jgi:hypothetical protein
MMSSCGDQAISSLKPVSEDDCIHVSQRWVSNQSGTVGSFTTKHVSGIGQSMTSTNQWYCHLTQSAFSGSIDATDWDNLAVVDHHLSLTSCRLHTLINQLSQGVGSHKS